MNYILNIETATRNCSVSLAQDGIVIASREVAEQGYSHAEKLHVFIEAVLEEAKITFAQLSAVAVSQGPGSYTGLRIGVSAAKGLCFALSIPLIAIDTLAVLAQQVNIEDGLIIPMIDARRMEVYSAVFNKDHQCIRAVEAEILTKTSFNDYSETLYFVGDSSQKAATLLHQKHHVYIETAIFPSANEMASLSFEKFKHNLFEDLAYFQPLYLKEFQSASSVG